MSTLPTLRDIEYRVFYRPHDNPLETFYLPTLAASVQYDRSAGYFRSSALAAAAAGIVRLIQNQGRMRLLVGAELSLEDVEAIKRGYSLRERLSESMLGHFPDPRDGALQQRLEALAWMVAHGTLDIKVVLPLDANGLPIAGAAAHDYYHTKKGIFTDAGGNQVGFVGSINESAQAWKRNFEEFSVYLSWEGRRDREALGSLRASFNELWEGHDPHWLAVDLPEAVQRKLLKYTPAHPPTSDALERVPPRTLAEEDHSYGGISTGEQLKFQFLRDAPYFPHAHELGAQTSTITPWPHQLKVARTIVKDFPKRALLCDEVGLGKTIEAGLIIRQLILSGRVKRCLILTPAAVLRQWQEELYEKFNLSIPRYQARQLFDVQGQPIGALLNQPWDQCDLLLASSHLAKRQERVPELEAARPWDLIIVDEAHHARRKAFQQARYRPNRLLTLLNRLKEKKQYQALLLLTATPMQVSPVEVWDLLTVLGLGGRWGASEDHFLNFFKQLQEPYDEAEWDFVYDMVADYLKQGQIDAHFQQTMQQALGGAYAKAICDLPHHSSKQRQQTLRALPQEARPYVREMARRHTPLADYLYRNTRDLLRQYVKQGLLTANVPQRQPVICRISLRASEEVLYHRITDYISQFYKIYEEERRGLGFIMTVYRRRLTSSFFAIRASLQRRRDMLRGMLEPNESLTLEDQELWDQFDDEEQDALQPLTARGRLVLTKEGSQAFKVELEYLEGFINDLRALSQADSKLTYLKDELDRLFRTHHTIIIFTQYTDTMDYLREQLQTVYGADVGCYSGRGGETWNGITWVRTPKEKVKNNFRSAKIKILLCTESASEGLNLQTCGILINYDMPWNPMRVEQRIGRIDRIGQSFAEVQIYNYFYRDTIEDRIYQALKDRINWFEQVVGNLQPILASVNHLTRNLAMLPAQAQLEQLESEIKRIRQDIDKSRLETLNLTTYLKPEEPDNSPQSPITPISLKQIEEILTQSHATRHLFRAHPDIPETHILSWQNQPIAVTFNAQQFDTYPDTLQLLSYGNPIFDALLASIPAPTSYPAHLRRHTQSKPFPIRAWYHLEGTSATPIKSLSELEKALNMLAAPTSPIPNAQSAALALGAAQQFTQQSEQLTQSHQKQLAQHTTHHKSTLRRRARRLLEKAALIEIALAQQPSLFPDEQYATSFSQKTVAQLIRHGKVWQWMIVIGGKPLPIPNATDTYFEEIRYKRPRQLKETLKKLTQEAKEVKKAWNSIKS